MGHSVECIFIRSFYHAIQTDLTYVTVVRVGGFFFFFKKVRFNRDKILQF